jgi:hypothetical protein
MEAGKGKLGISAGGIQAIRRLLRRRISETSRYDLSILYPIGYFDGHTCHLQAVLISSVNLVGEGGIYLMALWRSCYSIPLL